jgi:hypothetical protein
LRATVLSVALNLMQCAHTHATGPEYAAKHQQRT